MSRRDPADDFLVATRMVRFVAAWTRMERISGHLRVAEKPLLDPEPRLACAHAMESIGPFFVPLWDRTQALCWPCLAAIGMRHDIETEGICDACGRPADTFHAAVAMAGRYVLVGACCPSCKTNPERWLR